MSKAIYLLVLAQGFTEAWYQLSEEQQNSLWAKVQEVDQRAGAKWLVRCNSRWADEAIAGWVVIEYPNIEAYLNKVAELEELNWWRYFSAKTILGTDSEEP